MQIEVALSQDDKDRLAAALGREAQVEEVAELVARAGAAELIAMATGRAVPNTIAEMRAHRILFLLQAGMTLSDAETLVAAVFKVPSGGARRMVSNAVARFSVELQEGVVAEVIRLLEDASWDKGNKQWAVSVPSTFIRDKILDALARAPLPDPERAQRGPVWSFANETYQELRKQFALGENPPPE